MLEDTRPRLASNTDLTITTSGNPHLYEKEASTFSETYNRPIADVTIWVMAFIRATQTGIHLMAKK